jgi:hypothetical protein
MNNTAIVDLGFLVEAAPAAGMNASPQPAEYAAGKPHLPAFGSRPLETGAGRMIPRETLSPASHRQDPPPEPSIQWENGYRHQNVLTSLCASHPL